MEDKGYTPIPPRLRTRGKEVGVIRNCKLGKRVQPVWCCYPRSSEKKLKEDKTLSACVFFRATVWWNEPQFSWEPQFLLLASPSTQQKQAQSTVSSTHSHTSRAPRRQTERPWRHWALLWSSLFYFLVTQCHSYLVSVYKKSLGDDISSETSGDFRKALLTLADVRFYFFIICFPPISHKLRNHFQG